MASIDPILSLALSMQSNKGIYAMLLGSGVSRSAQIPTGWEVAEDLMRKIATLRGEECGDDPAGWYGKTFAVEPDYSDLLAAIAKKPAERKEILRNYFEPTTEERNKGGVKVATRAHKAIARLVAKGYARVIVTTNFDRLMESALQAEGIVPTLISTPDAVLGATPMVHTRCSVIKVHGDYMDNRIKNTPAELGKYDRRINKMLDRIFDEFGLIVCGWSSECDIALRAALERCPTRRFSTFWAAHGVIISEAERLIANRQAQVLRIASADDFFAEVEE
jgi:SIR2-like domain